MPKFDDLLDAFFPWTIKQRFFLRTKKMSIGAKQFSKSKVTKRKVGDNIEHQIIRQTDKQ